MKRPSSVRVSTQTITLPTWLSAPPDKNPMFLEKRVYQGSSGRVYPLPFTDRISEKPVPRKWQAVWIENEFVRALVLPEIGGRIHAFQDKTNGYDLIYNQSVIKPALVGLAGPWISGGIEFNWPQHHRPATFLPVDFAIESQADGSKTIWCGDHDPICAGLILLATLGKLGGSLCAARGTGLDWHDAFVLGALMNTRGLVELIVLNLGLDLGILSQSRTGADDARPGNLTDPTCASSTPFL